MAYEFKNLNEIPTQDAPTENTTVMAFESGNPKQIPAGKFGGNGKGLVVDLRSYTISQGSETIISDINYDPIYEAIMAGQNVVFQIMQENLNIFTTPLMSALVPESGFMIAISNILNTETPYLALVFTNGSYHTIA